MNEALNRMRNTENMINNMIANTGYMILDFNETYYDFFDFGSAREIRGYLQGPADNHDWNFPPTPEIVSSSSFLSYFFFFFRSPYLMKNRRFIAASTDL